MSYDKEMTIEEEKEKVGKLIRKVSNDKRSIMQVVEDNDEIKEYLLLRSNSLNTEIKTCDYHYVYVLIDQYTDDIYVGMRSSTVPPADDIDYMGSGKGLDRDRTRYKKYILAECPDRNIAHILETMIVDDKFVNREDTINKSSNCASTRLVNQKEGIQRAKDQGKYFGRPPSIDKEEIVELKEKGLSAIEIVERTGVSRPSVYRILGEKADV